MNNSVCQVCGRQIESQKGVIAHHGYKRPGDGWQTASCLGARYLPYQESCNRLIEVAQIVREYIVRQQQELADFLINPPQTLSVFINKSAYQQGKEIVCQRPEDLDINSYGYKVSSGMPRTYEYAHSDIKRNYERVIRFAQEDVVIMEQRIVNWKLCKEEGKSVVAPKPVSVPRVKKPAKPIKSYRCFVEDQSEFKEEIIQATSYQKAKEQYEKILKSQDERKYYRCGVYFSMKAKEIK